MKHYEYEYENPSSGMAPVRREKVSKSVIVSACCHRGLSHDNCGQLPLVAVASGTREFDEYSVDLGAIDEEVRI